MTPFVHPLRLSVALAACAAFGLALAATPTEVPGGRDPAVVTRYQGAVMQNIATERFASLRLPLGPGRLKDGRLEFDKSVTVEGSVAAYYYVQPAAATAVEVFRNYQAALGAAGFTPLYSCEAQACSTALLPEHYRPELLGQRPWANGRIHPAGGGSPRELRYWSGKASRDGREVVVVVWVTEASSTWNAPTASVVVVEPQAMEGGKVTASLEQMQQGLKADGKIALYGVYFDTGKAELKPESKAQLDEMARLLKAQAALRLYIVGHTDNQGTLESNLQLSQRRAEAVVAALTDRYGIDGKRLSARGVASLAPVASNDHPAGQARNRRVEMVVQ